MLSFCVILVVSKTQHHFTMCICAYFNRYERFKRLLFTRNAVDECMCAQFFACFSAFGKRFPCFPNACYILNRFKYIQLYVLSSYLVFTRRHMYAAANPIHIRKIQFGFSFHLKYSISSISECFIN